MKSIKGEWGRETEQRNGDFRFECCSDCGSKASLEALTEVMVAMN